MWLDIFRHEPICIVYNLVRASCPVTCKTSRDALCVVHSHVADDMCLCARMVYRGRLILQLATAN
jgi:hypothetical protein